MLVLFVLKVIALLLLCLFLLMLCINIAAFFLYTNVLTSSDKAQPDPRVDVVIRGRHEAMKFLSSNVSWPPNSIILLTEARSLSGIYKVNNDLMAERISVPGVGARFFSHIDDKVFLFQTEATQDKVLRVQVQQRKDKDSVIEVDAFVKYVIFEDGMQQQDEEKPEPTTLRIASRCTPLIMSNSCVLVSNVAVNLVDENSLTVFRTISSIYIYYPS